MPRGRVISLDLRLVIVNMWLEKIKTKYIAQYLGVALRSVQRIIANAREGRIAVASQRAPQPTRKLHEDSIRVSTLLLILVNFLMYLPVFDRLYSATAGHVPRRITA
jgi:hypothetical protein